MYEFHDKQDKIYFRFPNRLIFINIQLQTMSELQNKIKEKMCYFVYLL